MEEDILDYNYSLQAYTGKACTAYLVFTVIVYYSGNTIIFTHSFESEVY